MSGLPVHLVTYPRTIDAQREAIAQDVAALGGDILHLPPAEHLRRFFPERWFGLWHRNRLRSARFLHVWHRPCNLWVLKNLNAKIVWSIPVSCTPRQLEPLRGLRGLHALLLASPADAAAAQRAGWTQASHIPPGIDLSRFERHPVLPLDASLRIMCASAPWQREDFLRKGIDGLLAALKQRPNIHVTFMWRNLWLQEMVARISAAGLQARVHVIDRRVDIGQALASHHGAILLCNDPSVIKAYPNSLMEALACGRPVITSSHIAMGEIVSRHRCGVIAPDVTENAIGVALDTFVAHYPALASRAQDFPRETFSRARWCDAHRDVYATLCKL